MRDYDRDYGRRGYPPGEHARYWMGAARGWAPDPRPGMRGYPPRGEGERWGGMHPDTRWGWPEDGPGYGGGGLRERYDVGYRRGYPPGAMDYRGGYGRTFHPGYDLDYGRDYGHRGPVRSTWGRGHGRSRPGGRPRVGPDGFGWGFEGEAYGDYGMGTFRGSGLFRDARRGGIAPGRYFTGYGIGSSGGYAPY